MHKFGRLLLTAALAAAGVGIGAAGASAAGECDLGYHCMWVNTSYTGTMRGTSWQTYNAETGSLNNRFSSLSANGQNCMRSRFYDRVADFYAATQWPGYTYTSLASKQDPAPLQWKDPNLVNGTEIDSLNINWDDRIGGAMFASCG